MFTALIGRNQLGGVMTTRVYTGDGVMRTSVSVSGASWAGGVRLTLMSVERDLAGMEAPVEMESMGLCVSVGAVSVDRDVRKRNKRVMLTPVEMKGSATT